MDFRWQGQGGILLDSSGDIAMGGADGMESLQDMIRTRLKADLNGWQLYAIGADLQNLIGEVVDAETELAVKRQVTQSLTNDLLPSGSFQVETLSNGNRIHVFVYANQKLLASTVLTRPAQ